MLAMPQLRAGFADVSGRVPGYACASVHRPHLAYRWSADLLGLPRPEYRSKGLGRLLYERPIAEVHDPGSTHDSQAYAGPSEASIGPPKRWASSGARVPARRLKARACRDLGCWHTQRGVEVAVKACLNGGRMRGEHPAVPQTAAELAADALSVRGASAFAVHVHPRDAAGAQTLQRATPPSQRSAPRFPARRLASPPPRRSSATHSLARLR